MTQWSLMIFAVPDREGADVGLAAHIVLLKRIDNQGWRVKTT